MPPDQPAAGPLIGRSDELAQLASLAGIDADNGAGSVVVAGDAGVGKTRLLSELRDQARAAGWRTVLGHCLDFGDSALPYLPFSEAFGRLAADSPALAEALVTASPAVARLMPGRRFLSDGDHAEAERVERADLFDAIHRALDQLAVSEPLLLVVEDLHWADESTREMLSFLFARPFNGRVAIVASYRSDDLHRRHPLRKTVAEWSRLSTVTWLQLQPLPDADVRTLVRSLHAAPMPERALQTIVSRAEGNAFFTEELVAATELGATSLPTNLADLLLVRLDQLDDATRVVVRAAAVAGRRVSHELLAHVVDIDAGGLDLALRAAVERNVLVAVSSESYAFRHALLAEAVYDDLLPGERVRLHAAYVTALQSSDVDGTAAELARHARAAHDLTTAVVASVAAGDEAMAVAGPDEAARHYELALELLADDSTGVAVDQGIDLIDLAVKASDAAAAAGHPLRALKLVQEQLRTLPKDAPALSRAQLLHAVAAASFLSDNQVDALDFTTEALQLLPDDPAPLRAQLLGVHARAASSRSRDVEAAKSAREAFQLGRDLNLPDVVANAKVTFAKLDERAGETDSSQKQYEKSITEARAVGEITAELRAIFLLGGLQFERLGQLPKALETYQLATRRAEELGRPWAPYGVDARAVAGIVAYVIGDWDTARRIVDVSGQSPPAFAEALLASVGLTVAAGQGDESALDLLEQLRPWWSRDALIAIHSGAAAIDLYGDRGDIDEAIAIHDEAISSASELWRDDAFGARIRMSGLLLGQLANAATRASAEERPGLRRRGEELVKAAQRAVDHSEQLGRRQGPEGEAWMARVEAEDVRLRWLTDPEHPAEDELVRRWQRAVEAFEELGHVFEVARSQARLAVVLRAVGRADEARDLTEAARDTARRLGAQPLVGELRTLGPPRSARRAAASPRDQDLTPREQEILTLVAQGRTNREIAGQLYISAKTVSVHISNILSKLGAGGRTEAVALARRRGLLAD